MSPAADGLEAEASRTSASSGAAAGGRRLFGATADADSAGQPWAGRSFQPNPAAADDGAADPVLLAALTAFASGADDPVAIVEAFRTARLLVPLVAHAGDVGHAPDGHLVDKTQELAIVTVAGPDGRRVLPAFSSVEAMRLWDPKARPVPAAGPRIALAAASEGTELVVVDPASPHEHVLRRPAVRALATGATWIPAAENPAVAAAFAESVAADPDAVAVALEGADPAYRLRAEELLVRLTLRPGLDQAGLDAAVRRLGAAWAASAAIADGVDSLRLALR
ncbi:SseB family protein [Gryllotalpicola sp.]|uniref:SseB family protein n=1 Tax=Gryllotalpicola sp. TaxID=1932787 RepID=UPI00260B165C|nr:SseB family protein [Gryllotalpicola sp.]